MNVKRKYQSKTPKDRSFALRQVEDIISLDLVYFENKDKKDLIDGIVGLVENFDLATLREVFTHCATVAATQGVPVSGPAKSPVDPRLPLLPDGRPALWTERTTGREVSPVDFIKAHYGDRLEDMRRADLPSIDYPLSQAYAQWIKRHPEDRILSEEKVAQPARKPVEPLMPRPSKVAMTEDERRSHERRLAAERQARYREKRLHTSRNL